MNQTSPHPKLTLRRRLERMLVICLALYLTAGVVVTIFQRRLIYHPATAAPAVLEQSAKAEGLERWKNPAGQAIGWQGIVRSKHARGQALVLHGNAGCAVDRSDYVAALQRATAFDVFILEYPGYGDRPGSPSQRSLCEAAGEAVQLLAAKGPVYLVGESLGTGVAAYLAGAYPTQVAGLLLIAPYHQLADVAQCHMPIFPARWLLRDRFPSEEFLRQYHGPVAVVLAGQDQVIPNKFGRRLYEGYAGAKRLWEFAEADHETVIQQSLESLDQAAQFWRTNSFPER